MDTRSSPELGHVSYIDESSAQQGYIEVEDEEEIAVAPRPLPKLSELGAAMTSSNSDTWTYMTSIPESEGPELATESALGDGLWSSHHFVEDPEIAAGDSFAQYHRYANLIFFSASYSCIHLVFLFGSRYE